MWWLALIQIHLPYVEVRGNATLPTLLVVPGGGGHTLRKVDELRNLEEHFRVVHYDPCGVGASDCPIRDTWEEMIDDVVAVARAYPPDYLVGHSSGCFVADRVARAMPVQGTLCIAPVFDYADTKESVTECLADKLRIPRRAVDWMPYPVRQGLRFMLCGTECGQRRDAVRALLTCENYLLRDGVRVALQMAAQRYRVRHDYTRQRLPANLSRPLRILVGEHDRITTPESVRAHAPSDVPVRVVPDTSHALPWEAPDVVLEEALALLPA